MTKTRVDEDDDGEVTTVDVKSRAVPEASSATSAKDIERKQKELVRKQKAADRASYQELRREAAKATSALAGSRAAPGPVRSRRHGRAGGLVVLREGHLPESRRQCTANPSTHWLPITHPETAIIVFLVTVGGCGKHLLEAPVRHWHGTFSSPGCWVSTRRSRQA